MVLIYTDHRDQLGVSTLTITCWQKNCWDQFYRQKREYFRMHLNIMIMWKTIIASPSTYAPPTHELLTRLIVSDIKPYEAGSIANQIGVY